MYYPPKKDLWVGIVSWGCMLFFTWAVIKDWPSHVLLIPGLACLAWIWFGTGYNITENSLKVKCDPYEKKIPFSKIRKVKRSKYKWFSAALSLDLLQIKYDYGVISVSPLDSFSFIYELKQKCPEADFSGL